MNHLCIPRSFVPLALTLLVAGAARAQVPGASCGCGGGGLSPAVGYPAAAYSPTVYSGGYQAAGYPTYSAGGMPLASPAVSYPVSNVGMGATAAPMSGYTLGAAPVTAGFQTTYGGGNYATPACGCGAPAMAPGGFPAPLMSGPACGCGDVLPGAACGGPACGGDVCGGPACCGGPPCEFATGCGVPCGGPPACLEEDDEYPCFRFTAEALFLNLSNPKSRPLAYTGIVPVLTSDSLDNGTHAGPRFTLELAGETRIVQFIYFGTTWDDTTAIAGAGLLIPGGANAATTITASANAALNNEELNFVSRPGDSGFSFLWGFRHIGFSERLRIRDNGGDFYNISTNNELWGLQAGARYYIPLDRFGIQLTGKIGGFQNPNWQHSVFNDAAAAANSTDVTRVGRKGTAAGDFGVSFFLPLGDHFRLCAGYNLLWLGSVARAADQLPSNNVAPLNTNVLNHSSAFMHGANVGLDVVWGAAPRRR